MFFSRLYMYCASILIKNVMLDSMQMLVYLRLPTTLKYENTKKIEIELGIEGQLVAKNLKLDASRVETRRDSKNPNFNTFCLTFKSCKIYSQSYYIT